MTAELSLTVQRDGARAVAQVSGAMDYDTTGLLEQALADLVQDGARHLVLDMAAVGFCDSSGINALIRTLARVREQQGSLVLAAVTPRVQGVLEMTGVDAVIPTHPSVAAALDAPPA
ncbi:STAS domain-containing protein [Streptacidiphilus sp. N1-12]|uniref:Anti-sigma factor antagonist n=2 Tax=Streptacidiphilus alkalitolerans TaxID=3342712 RepID=A0ABV6W9N4_9ACTN